MGFLKKLRSGASAWREEIARVNAITNGAHETEPLEILNPSPQHAVDRLLAGGGVARGVVVKASYAPNDNERVNKIKVTVHVRARLAEGELGQTCEVKIWTGWQVTALLDRGLEIPVELDPTRQVVVGIPTDALRAELEPRFDEAAKRHPGGTSTLRSDGFRECAERPALRADLDGAP
jgi:hypothetical protein